MGRKPRHNKVLGPIQIRKRTEELKRVLICGLILESALGTILTVTSISLAEFLAATVFNRPNTSLSSLIEIMSITILAQALILTSKSAFIDFERTEYYSVTMILQSSVKTLARTLVLLGYGALGVVLGRTVSLYTAAALAIAQLSHQNWTKLALGGAAFITTYLIAIPDKQPETDAERPSNQSTQY